MDSVIVLNKNYQYWTEADIKKVLKWITLNKIEVILSHETEEIGSIQFKIKMPLIVRLLNFVGFKPKKNEVPYSQHAIFERDNNVCQYWHYNETGKKYKYKCSEEDRTIDHIVPVSKGGINSYKNCVCACRNCNEKVKKNRTPQEAGLELIREPFIPTRDRDSFIVMKFTYNTRKLSHKVYFEQFLGKKFSHIV